MLTCATCTREPVCCASSASRAMMLASATGGQPGRPSRPEISPSWQQACGPARLGSWLCWLTTPSKARTYSSARRMTRPSATQWPSSEKTLVAARERCIRPSSASSAPASPLVTAPTGTTSTSPAARPRSRMRSAASAVSVTGLVLAMASTAVKPPTAAAREPEAIVSASSRPGSRRWVCRSTNPGRRVRPSASSVSASSGASTEPTSATTPSRSSTSPVEAVPFSSYQVGPVRSRVLTRPPPLRRGGGRARTFAPRPRPRPGRAPGSGRRRRHPR